jgi:membrane-associated phospholipid phosphatase
VGFFVEEVPFRYSAARMIRFALLAILVGGTALADEGDRVQALSFSAEPDGTVLAFTGFAWLAGEFMQPSIITRPTCNPCLASDVNPLDRSLAGQRNATASAISYGTLGLLLAAPLVADGIDLRRSGGALADFGDDLGVYLQALAVDGAINQAVKLAVHRPRPLAYDPTLPADTRASAESYVSFYSEHASLGFTAAAAWVTTYALHHRHRRGAIAAIASIAVALAGTTAALRLVAGAHFYSDVAVGALAGTTIGTAIPLLHRRGAPIRVSLAPVDGGFLFGVTLHR